MNEDGSLGTPHGASQEEETPIAEPNFSSNQEDTEISSTDASAVDDTAISHDSPIEAPIATESDEEPVDIFASPEEQAAEAESASTPGEAPTAITSGSSDSHSITNSPFHNRNRFQANTNTTNSNVPQFFSDSMVASTPISQPRQSKKGLFIGIAIGGIALIGIVLMVIAITKGGGGILGIGGVNLSESKQTFNTYANKLLFDKDSKDTIPARDYNYKYSYLSKVDDNNKINGDYATSLISLYDSYLSALTKQDQEKLNQKLKSYSDENKKALSFLKVYSGYETIESGHIILAYMSGGKTTAQKQIKDYLNYFSDDKSYSKNYKEAKEVEFNNALKIAESAQKHGCLQENKYSQCMDSLYSTDPDDIGIGDLYNEMLESSHQAEKIAENAYSDLSLFCWEISDLLNGEKK